MTQTKRMLAGLFTMVLAACSPTSTRCTEGVSVACACPDGRTGAQTCMASGAFGACVCLAPDSGPTADATASDVPSVDVVVADVPAAVDVGRDSGPLPSTGAVDLLVMVDNSNSMRENQANLMAQLGPMINALTDPSHGGTVTDLHVGIVSSDLGSPGSSVPGCANSDSGDDGWLNPIRNGQALQRHLPWMSAPAGFRPDDCMRADQFPAFIAFNAATTPATFEHDFRCNAGLYVNGCGLEQQLESIWRALIWHHAEAAPGNTDMNAGFLRNDSILAILALSDEEDGSVRDCRYSHGEACTDAIDAFNASSSRWASANLNLRDYMYQPGSDQDPTWDLARYIDPTDPSRGFLGLKPGHPERVLFAAITGVPLVIPTVGTGISQRVVWDRLVGTPGTNPNDFTARNSFTAINEMSAEGPISMRQANADPSCAERTVPACRRAGSAYDPAHPPCTTTDQYFAWPARRIVEVARRFDEATLCGGAPCRNGMVASICANNYGPAIDQLAARITARRAGR